MTKEDYVKTIKIVDSLDSMIIAYLESLDKWNFDSVDSYTDDLVYVKFEKDSHCSCCDNEKWEEEFKIEDILNYYNNLE